MAIEGSKIVGVAHEVMEGLENKFREDRSAQVTSVFLTIAVDHNEGKGTFVGWKASQGMSSHEGLGLLKYVERGLAAQV